MSADGPPGRAAPPRPEDGYRPALRPGVLVSGEVLHGPRRVHLVKDTTSGQSFQVGVKEHFLIARMDGTRTPDEIGAAYARTYGKRLGEGHWRQILGLLGGRGLLASGPAPSGPSGTAGAGGGDASGDAEAPGGRTAGGPGTKPGRNGVLAGSVRLVADAHATAGRLHDALGFLLARRWALPLLFLVTVMALVLAWHVGELATGAVELFRHPVLLTAGATLLWLSTALHELAHGLVARHYGGRVGEIGLRWRFPVVIMYCTVEDYLYLPGRTARIATALAGAVTNLLFLLPFFAVWALARPAGATGQALGGFLFLGTLQALAMLVPLPPLDGYKVVGQLLGTAELAASSRRYVALALRRDPEAARYPPRARRAYRAYAAGSVVVVLLLLTGAVLLVRHVLTTA
ncbi:M50 family metallopeptidase [Streptomyces sp. GSL17-111]|uniref:M50 family metallopeptidase n=1 Tax=Streptomyces sp. GSL17-111 TaxID=3121596 RepID=UPI0030F4A24F